MKTKISDNTYLIEFISGDNVEVAYYVDSEKNRIVYNGYFCSLCKRDYAESHNKERHTTLY